MTCYGKAAVKTVKDFYNKIDTNSDPIEELKNLWAHNTSHLSKGKDCPKSTFLGLCSAGHIVGIPCLPYTRSISNRRYGETAVKLLRSFPCLANNITPDELWELVIDILRKCKIQCADTHNHQMEVVLALWKAHFII